MTPARAKKVLTLAKAIHAIATPAFTKVAGYKIPSWSKATKQTKAAILAIADHLLKHGIPK